MTENSPKKDSIKEIIFDFGANTTIHSISKQVNPKTPILRKLIWMCLFLASLCYLLYQAKELISLYGSRPVTIRNDWTTSRRLAFPAVTICNLNPLRKSQINNSSKFWKDISNENSTVWDRTQCCSVNGIFSNLGVPQGRGNSQEQHIRRILNTFINVMNETERRRMGHQAKDLIVKCTWKEERCEENFTQFFTPTYGNCYTFNVRKNGETLYATSTGDEEPLALTLNVEGDEYVGALSPYLGVILELHHPDIMPFPIEHGEKMSPGFSTNIGISKIQFLRLGDPFSKCRNENEILYTTNKRYSVNACLRLCEANTSIEKCGCVKPIYDINPACDPFNETDRACLKEMEDSSLEKALLECKCYPPCSETVYEYSSSFSVWPSEQSWIYLKQDLENRTSRHIVSSLKKARENLLNVHIFYKTLGFRTTLEIEGYKMENLIGDLGGQFGLFVGMSLLSLVEVFELVIDVITRLLKRDHNNVRSISIKKQVETET